jgi:hypothetical protein
MATYALYGNQSTLATTAKGTLALWTATTLRRLKIYEYLIGATGVPNATDCNITIDISRLSQTTSLAGSAYTPQATDPGDGTAVGVATVNVTTEPAAALIATATPMAHFGLNQRNTVRWIAAQESQYLISPATAVNGFYMTGLSPNYASSLSTMVYYLE